MLPYTNRVISQDSVPPVGKFQVPVSPKLGTQHTNKNMKTWVLGRSRRSLPVDTSPGVCTFPLVEKTSLENRPVINSRYLVYYFACHTALLLPCIIHHTSYTTLRACLLIKNSPTTGGTRKDTKTEPHSPPVWEFKRKPAG